MGSLVLGSRDFIDRAHRARKLLGGGMRQVGILAAAGLWALDHHVKRLAEDHANARHIAEAIAVNPGLEIEPAHVETNILYFKVKAGEERAAQLVAELETEGVKAWALGSLIRLVTSLNVDRAGCDFAADRIDQLLN